MADDGSLLDDYHRLGVLDESDDATLRHFCINTEINAQYQLCSTYPSMLVVPSQAPPEMLRNVASFRSRNRLPVLVWRDPANSAGHLVRCAQPKRGILGKKDSWDEAYVGLIEETAVRSRSSPGGPNRRMVVFDCRSFTAAHANEFRGGGVESAQRYGARAIEYAALHNVHYVRRVVLAIRHRAPGQAAHSQWVRAQAALLRASLRVAQLLRDGATILLHCSDGWDRTPVR